MRKLVFIPGFNWMVVFAAFAAFAAFFIALAFFAAFFIALAAFAAFFTAWFASNWVALFLFFVMLAMVEVLVLY